jgi:hypothetical protein
MRYDFMSIFFYVFSTLKGVEIKLGMCRGEIE